VASHLGSGYDWPLSIDKNDNLKLEMLVLSLQVGLTLICGISFFDLSDTQKPSENKKLIRKIASAQIVFGLLIGIAFHVITILRSKSGDNTPAPTPYDFFNIALIGQATAPALLAPLLMWIWSRTRGSIASMRFASFILPVIGGAF